MTTKDWVSITDPTTLLVGETSLLQWSDEIIDHVMFLDYYFQPKPYDLGERSRYSEAKRVFDMIRELTNGTCHPENLYATNITFDILPRPPKGKRILIPENSVKDGTLHISRILNSNPTITQVFVMGMQANYHLQKLGFCTPNPEYIAGAAPRNTGLAENFYQPVNGKVFRKICCHKIEIPQHNAVLIPILPSNEYPLQGDKDRIYGQSYETLIQAQS